MLVMWTKKCKVKSRKQVKLIKNIKIFIDIPYKKFKKKNIEPLSGNIDYHGILSNRSSLKNE